MSELSKLVTSLGSAILGVEDFPGLLSEATETIAASVPADFVSIHLDQGGHRFEWRFDRHGRVPASFAPQLAPRVAEATGRRSHVIGPGAAQTSGLADAGLGCAIVTPVAISKDESLLLCVAFSDPTAMMRVPLVDDLEAIATLLAVGSSRHAFQQLAMIDPSTRLYNRRYLDATLPGEVERAVRYKHPLGVLLLDVDHFKRINDRHGHPTGDKVLAEIARVLLDTLRTCDVAVRLGGDEFLVLLPATTASGARRMAERVLERVRALSFGDARAPLRVTVSGGVAIADGRSTVESLLGEADHALYSAKRGGRDQIVVPEMTPIFDAEPSEHRRGRRRSIRAI